MKKVGKSWISECGAFSRPTNVRTSAVRVKNHERFCEACSGPDAVEAARAKRSKRRKKSPPQTQDGAVRPVSADETEPPPGGTPVSVEEVQSILADAGMGSGSRPDPEVLGPDDPENPASEDYAPPDPVSPPPQGAESALPIDADEWTELAEMLHDSESAIAVMATKLEAVAMPEKMNRMLSKFLGKILAYLWGRLDIDKAIKILITFYALGQVAYLGVIISAVREEKARKEEEARGG